MVTIVRGDVLERRFGGLTVAALAGALGMIAVFIGQGAISGGHAAWAVAIATLYAAAVSVLAVALALRYWASREWHYLWRWSIRQVHGSVPAQTGDHGRLAFLAERILWVAVVFCAGVGLVGWAAHVGPAAWVAAVAGCAAALVMFAAMMRDMVDAIRTQFRKPQATPPTGAPGRRPRR
ncbi:MAG TPA: hypothetical protein VE733_17455 [Streptosporangiaceae bacterium]|jgi:O-antigen/teichoic acid export membrane protein|nr:hypothetical protein [Streptosporangiaceae bacterium]